MKRQIRQSLAWLMVVCMMVMVFPMTALAVDPDAALVDAAKTTAGTTIEIPYATYTTPTTYTVAASTAVQVLITNGVAAAVTYVTDHYVLTLTKGVESATVNPYGVTIAVSKVALTAAITTEVGSDHANPTYTVSPSTYYTPVSWLAYTTATDNAVTVENDATATQIQVDAAITAITAAKTGLVAKYTLTAGAQTLGGAGYTRDITVQDATASGYTGMYLVVEYTTGTGASAVVSATMIKLTANATITVSYQTAGTIVRAWLTSDMPNLTAATMGVTVYANVASSN